MARDAWDVKVARFGGARMWRFGAGFVELSESALVVTESGRVLEAGATFTAKDGALSVLPHALLEPFVRAPFSLPFAWVASVLLPVASALFGWLS